MMPAPQPATPQLMVKGPALLGRCPRCGTTFAAVVLAPVSQAVDDAPRDFIACGYRLDYLPVGEVRVLRDCTCALPSEAEIAADLRRRRRDQREED